MAREPLSLDKSINPAHTNMLQKRKDRVYQVLLDNGFLLILVAAAYPTTREYFESTNGAILLSSAYRLIAGWCIGPAISTQTVPKVPNPPNIDGLDMEHPLDVS